VSHATVILASAGERDRAIRWIATAPPMTRVDFSKPKRSLPQNDKIHALCTDVAGQIEWAGKRRDVEAWKDIFTAALLSERHELDVVPGINGGFVLLGMHTSAMSKEEASDLIELILAFGAEHGVRFSEALVGEAA
jgi:hypothetical protein